MFGWFSRKRYKDLEEKTQGGFSSVKKDIKTIGKWIKHFERQDRQLFMLLSELRKEISVINDDIGSLREGVDLISRQEENKQLFRKLPFLDKQTNVYSDQDVVQMAVQTSDYYKEIRRLSANERLVVLTLMNTDMKLSYEDISLLLGKERSTIRGQINSIRQKSESLIQEVTEKNGKKRIFIPEEIKKKMLKYVKVRAKNNVGTIMEKRKIDKETTDDAFEEKH